MNRIKIPRYINNLGTYLGDLRSWTLPSQIEAAKKFGVSHSTISRYEGNVSKPPSIDYLVSLAFLVFERLKGKDGETVEIQKIFLHDLNAAIREHYAGIKLFNNWDEIESMAFMHMSKTDTTHQIKHRVIMVTGLTSAGKDSLLSYVWQRGLDETSNIFFLTKATARQLRFEESILKGEEQNKVLRALPYDVIRVSPEELLDDDSIYFGVRNLYGNPFGFSKQELFEILGFKHNTNIVFIHSDLRQIKSIMREVQVLCKRFEDDFNQEQKGNFSLSIATECVLVDAPLGECLTRLKLRGIPAHSRVRRVRLSGHLATFINSLKAEDFFDHTIYNGNDRTQNESIRDMKRYLQQGLDGI